jgi:hypothetical protein
MQLRTCCVPRCWNSLASALHAHQLTHGHHVVVQVAHDPGRSKNDQEKNQDSEGKGKHIVRIVRSAGDVQEENQMNPAPAARVIHDQPSGCGKTSNASGALAEKIDITTGAKIRAWVAARERQKWPAIRDCRPSVTCCGWGGRAARLERLAPACAALPSISPRAPWRHHPRWEPTVVLHDRIREGAVQWCAFLLRLQAVPNLVIQRDTGLVHLCRCPA